MNKKMTIAEVEKMRGEMHVGITECIKKFEDETGMRVNYINMVRKKDKETAVGPACIDCAPHDRGEVVGINSDMNMEWD